MLVIGIIEAGRRTETVSAAQIILSSSGMKSNVLDSSNVVVQDPQMYKRYVDELEKNQVDALILRVQPKWPGEKVMEKVPIDILVSTGYQENQGMSIDEYRRLMRSLLSSMDEKGIAILNKDDNESLPFLSLPKPQIITFGFNSRASITASSVAAPLQSSNFICCLQHSIASQDGRIVEPQEFSIELRREERDAYDILAVASLAVVNGLDPNNCVLS